MGYLSTGAKRISDLSNPAFSPNARKPRRGGGVTASKFEPRDASVLGAEISLVDALRPLCARRMGPRQVTTGVYLVGLAAHRKGKRVTLDHSVFSLLPEKGAERGTVLIV